MARAASLKSMSIDKLSKLKDQVDAAIASRVVEERRTLQGQLGKLSRFEHGGARAGRVGSRGAIPPKYRNPDNPAETWAGRGLRPRWLAAALKSGKKLEHFAIGIPAKAASTKKMPKRTRGAAKK
jgi:DNA-binding protein H-NS